MSNGIIRGLSALIEAARHSLPAFTRTTSALRQTRFQISNELSQTAKFSTASARYASAAMSKEMREAYERVIKEIGGESAFSELNRLIAILRHTDFSVEMKKEKIAKSSFSAAAKKELEALLVFGKDLSGFPRDEELKNALQNNSKNSVSSDFFKELMRQQERAERVRKEQSDPHSEFFELLYKVEHKRMQEYMDKGFDINTKICDEYPLHKALKLGHKKTIYMFLNNGADPYLKDDSGKNAFEIALDSLKKRKDVGVVGGQKAICELAKILNHDSYEALKSLSDEIDKRNGTFGQPDYEVPSDKSGKKRFLYELCNLPQYQKPAINVKGREEATQIVRDNLGKTI